MKRLLSLLLLFLALLAEARADKWTSDQYRCELTMPDGESWGRREPRALPTGEIIFNATNKALEQNISVVVIPNLPSGGSLRNPGIVSRFLEVVSAMGFAASTPKPITFHELPYLEVVGRRDDGAGPKLVCVARATLREDTLYIVLTSATGSEERATDPKFLRVLETFKLVEETVIKANPVNHPYFQHYRLAYKASWAGALGILGMGLLVVLFSRRKA